GAQLGTQALRAVALADTAAHQHLGKTRIVLVMRLAETLHGVVDFVARIAVARQFGAKLPTRLLAPGQQSQRLVVGRTPGPLVPGGFVVTRTHDRRQARSGLFGRAFLVLAFGFFLGGLGLAGDQQLFAQLGVDLVGDLGVVLEVLAHVFLALADARAVVAVPGAGLV